MSSAERQVEADGRGGDLIVDKVPSQPRKSGQVAARGGSADRAGLQEERKLHVVSGGGDERVQPRVCMLGGGTRLGRPGSCRAPAARADLTSGGPPLGEQVRGRAAVAWHPHLTSEGVQRSDLGSELIALGAGKFTGGSLIWPGTAGAGSRWAERLVRCGFC